MAKGKSSGSTIKRIEHAVKIFIGGWDPTGNAKARNTTATAWPVMLRLAAFRGEAILRLRFFDQFLPSLPIRYDAPQTLALWQGLVENSGIIEDLVNRVGLARALRQEAALPENAAKEAQQLYFILCEAISQQAPHLMEIAVDQLLTHQWKQQYRVGDAAPLKARKPSAAALRDRLTLRLSNQHKRVTRIRESFLQEAEHVEFKLLYRLAENEPWVLLVCVERPRLQVARLEAYTTALAALKTNCAKESAA